MAQHTLVDLKTVDPTIFTEILYATPNNFTNTAVYTTDTCFLQKPVAEALSTVHNKLSKHGLALKVWDGYRPLSIQKIFWELVPDPRYVTDPSKGSGHNKGCAVDCTLVTPEGHDIMMPSEFDDFTERAHRDYDSIHQQANQNKRLLEKLMHEHGFIGLPTEWWHFDFKDSKNYPLLDIPFEEL